jgi:hypothetical protein
MIRLVVAFCAVLALSRAEAAELGSRFDSRDGMHRNTPYGALFFNEGATHKVQNRSVRNYVMVEGEGDLALPRQAGYCFLFNHRLLGGHNLLRTYRAAIIKWKTDSRQPVDSAGGSFVRNGDNPSNIPPDICISGLQDVTRVEIEFSFDGTLRRIAFTP